MARKLRSILVAVTMGYSFLLVVTLAQNCPDTYFLYKKNCVPCTCENYTEVCDKAAGTCSSGCRAGYRGQACQEVCPKGTFGKDCQSTCSCPPNCYTCDSVTGSCVCLGADRSTPTQEEKDRYDISSLTKVEVVVGLMVLFVGEKRH
ncbi:multiple epidermal growth factor-like domains protein 11 isoform X2 [Pomacea canaliculata]|uniref:multiple epidermal growth factor-like domains protein 11 isoform X2 n=1 Tax=Pomacea canaliculata TaxID=400727 RepID=UPI000D734146|nr:multiple epidermal growth factor-like domains protein 11 isoform X2 [Pomacea canaliculata]